MEANPQDLVRAALAAAKGAYAPYSRFRVGAALVAASGRVYTGANVENASYPCGICAERAALLPKVLAKISECALAHHVADGKNFHRWLRSFWG